MYTGNRPREPRDLRVAGRPDDPLFNRPLVRGTITPDGGVVEVRRPGSDEVERHEVRKVRKREEGVGQMNTAEAKATNGAPTGEVSLRLTEVAELYNSGETWESMTQKLGISDSTLGKYIRRARKVGLITVARERGRRPSSVSSDTPAPSNSEAVEDLVQRITRIEEKLQSLDQPASTPAPGIAILDDLSREMDSVRKELDIVAGGLAELSKRVRELEEQRPEGGSMIRELLRLLELALTGERRRIA